MPQRVPWDHASEALMRVSSRLIAFLFCIFTLCPRLLAQIDKSTDTGFPPYGVFGGGKIDTVQLNSGNLHIEIPIWRARGRGIDTNAKYLYDSKVWTVQWTT